MRSGTTRDFPTIGETYILRSMLAGNSTTAMLGLELNRQHTDMHNLLMRLVRKGLVRETRIKVGRCRVWELTQLGKRAALLAAALGIAKLHERTHS